MGLLTIGEPLDWAETKKNSRLVRRKGIEQFIKLYNTFKPRDFDSFKYGDEVEYSLVKFDHKEKRVFCLLKAQQILDSLLATQSPQALWSPEFANFMVEGLPGQPFNHDINSIRDIETNMVFRRKQVQELLETNEYVMTFSTFPLLGCPNFTWPNCIATPGRGITTSMFFPDNAIFPGHPRYAASIVNNRERRRVKSGANIPIYRDKHTPTPFKDTLLNYTVRDECIDVEKCGKWEHIYLDGIGAACSCLQVTFQARNLSEARKLYDQLAPVTPIVLALSASSPIWRGFLADIDCRWRVISESLDDRTPGEKGEEPLDHGSSRIYKSRYDSVDCYLSESSASLNDIEIARDEEAYNELITNGIDPLMAQHIAHLFVRDPLVLYKENLDFDNMNETDLWENINSTVWQSLRFKPPPNMNSTIGWRVEFRTTELQITDFENAAFVAFLVLLTRTILTFDLHLAVPISKVDENMKRAQKRDACLDEKFYFKKNLFDPSDVTCEEMTMNEIVNGNGDFPGLIPLVKGYLAQLDSIDVQTNCKIMHYLKLIEGKANGSLKTTANWMRTFVTNSPMYKHDSVVSDEIAYDLMWNLSKIANGLISAPDLNDTNNV